MSFRCWEWCLYAAFAGSSSLLVVGCTRSQPIQAKQESGPIPVQAAKVSAREVQRSIQSIGTLYAFDETVVSAEIEGRVLEVKADLGDSVQKGQVLVRIAEEEQKYVVAQTEAQLRMAMERVGLKHESDRVTDVREASEVRRAQADLTDAEQRFKRVRSLVDQGISSQAELDQSQARYRAAQAAYDQSINQARNLLQEIERSRAALDLQRKKLRDTTVSAPFSGQVKERTITPGSYVRPNAPLFTLVKVDPVRLRVEVPERMAPWVRSGQIADVNLEAYGDKIFKGRVWRISPTVDQSKRTFVVEALIDNPGGLLKPGSYAKVSMPTNKVEHIRLAPVRAVAYVFGSNKAYVIKTERGSREVKLGDRFEQLVEIIQGLEEGETVALTQLARLDTGSKVSIAAEKKAQ
ncbi:MAG: efflux RND transporter periplasmic adaptor subunit [Bryobacteraceae bacterium]